MVIADPIHPFYVGNIITILSTPYDLNDFFSIFIVFTPFEWFIIFLIFVFIIVFNVWKTFKKFIRFKIYDSIGIIILDHLNILLGKCEY